MSTDTTGNSDLQPSSSLSRHSSSDAIDSTPLLLNGGSNDGSVGGGGGNGQTSGGGRRSVRRQSLREAARFLRRASSGRMMRQPSMLVRETAAEQLEVRQSDWAYSKPVVVLDIVWNLAFVAVATAVIVLSRDEKPNMPLRVWIVGYALQCVLHMVCVCVEYRRRRVRSPRSRSSSSSSSSSSMEEEGLSSRRNSEERYSTLGQYEQEYNRRILRFLIFTYYFQSSAAKHLESANTMFSFIWWIIGFYWVSAGGQDLARGSPQLYWLCIVFLGFDVFFAVFCVALAFVIGIAVCCCLPCIIAVLYAVADQEGASKEDIEQLTKFKFRRAGDDVQGNVGGIMIECGTDSPIEHTLLQEDAECCICLSEYEEGVEVRELTCGHHFHCECVDKWLYMNSTCPLCKYNILHHSDEQQV
ncbi:PREDICTED: E3 ubiquitin-protein ligase At1g12760-like isoform X2 [Tarenaya hassleriana]|uniref:E3 ubiquitin-protein ligase At1g12760-like isoform X2 n=1 Tax=Tarenaya hassleriana TaxID=28532 RepID=UPI00053C377A|nr:PREDICTED: E3 ubiquitin-protein ligase At1g12760-like isoform X2 [Tarenaya hassleriana]